MVKIPKEVIDLFSAPGSKKMIATVDETGMPNVVFAGSITPVGEDTIAIAEVGIIHTKANLEKTKKASILVYQAPVTAYQLKGTCMGFQTSGPLFDNFAKKLAERKMNIKSVATIKINEVLEASPGKGSKKIA